MRQHYFFPSDEIPRLSDEDLLTFIERYSADALSMTDGTDPNSDVKIDYAQDVIEQARDQLVLRGHDFSPEDQQRLTFLKWPMRLEVVDAILRDKATSFWTVRNHAELMQRDPLDALDDARFLYMSMQARLAALGF